MSKQLVDKFQTELIAYSKKTDSISYREIKDHKTMSDVNEYVNYVASKCKETSPMYGWHQFIKQQIGYMLIGKRQHNFTIEIFKVHKEWAKLNE